MAGIKTMAFQDNMTPRDRIIKKVGVEYNGYRSLGHNSVVDPSFYSNMYRMITTKPDLFSNFTDEEMDFLSQDSKCLIIRACWDYHIEHGHRYVSNYARLLKDMVWEKLHGEDVILDGRQLAPGLILPAVIEEVTIIDAEETPEPPKKKQKDRKDEKPIEPPKIEINIESDSNSTDSSMSITRIINKDKKEIKLSLDEVEEAYHVYQRNLDELDILEAYKKVAANNENAEAMTDEALERLAKIYRSRIEVPWTAKADEIVVEYFKDRAKYKRLVKYFETENFYNHDIDELIEILMNKNSRKDGQENEKH